MFIYNINKRDLFNLVGDIKGELSHVKLPEYLFFRKPF